MMKATKGQKSQRDLDAEKQKREERLQARKGQELEAKAINAVHPEPDLELGDEAPSIEAQLLARQRYSLHVKQVDEAGVSIIW